MFQKKYAHCQSAKGPVKNIIFVGPTIPKQSNVNPSFTADALEMGTASIQKSNAKEDVLNRINIVNILNKVSPKKAK